MAQKRRPTSFELTAREREVAGLIARGHTNGEIAERLGISFSTAKWHVSEVITRLGVDSREQVAARWQDEQSLRSRLRRMPIGFAGLLSLKPVAAIAAGSAMAATAFLAYAIGLGGLTPNVFGDSDATAALSSPTTTTTPASEPAYPEGLGRYTAQEGDTCEFITSAFRMTMDELIALNPKLGTPCSLEPGDQLTVRGKGTTAPDNLLPLAHLNGDPSLKTLFGALDRDGSSLFLADKSPAGPLSQMSISSFREWEVFFAGGWTGDGVGGEMGVGTSGRVARLDVVTDGGPPNSYSMDGSYDQAVLSQQVGVELRFIYVSLPPGHIWEFRAYDSAGDYLGSIRQGTLIGAGDATLPRGFDAFAALRSRMKAPPAFLESDPGGLIVGVWPPPNTSVAQSSTVVGSINDGIPAGLCAIVTTAGSGPEVEMRAFELWFDGVHVTSPLAITPLDAPVESALLCYTPPDGIDIGLHEAEVRIRNSASPNPYYLPEAARWKFDVQ